MNTISLFALSEAQVLSEPIINWGNILVPIVIIITILVFSKEKKIKKPKKEAKRG